jgi:protein ImuB
VPLDRLGIEPAARDLLAKLGVRTVDRFLDLPAEGLRTRFGDEVRRLHRLASGETRDPLAPEPAAVPVRPAVAPAHPQDDGGRLLFLVKRLLDPLLLRTAERRESVAGIEIRLRLDDGGERTDTLRPAAPTLDAAQILELVRLRLESVHLRSGATDVTLTVEPVPATAEQLALFAEKPKRDLAAGDRALARLRAEFGEGAVVRATLRDAHLPEASFAWEPMEHLTLPRVRAASRPPLVRRIFARPRPLPSRPRHDPGHELGGWMLGGFEHGNVVRIDGPYVVAGGWWAGAGGGEVRREVHFAETSKGRLFWIYYDVRRRRWFLLGEVS